MPPVSGKETCRRQAASKTTARGNAKRQAKLKLTVTVNLNLKRVTLNMPV